eukprot:g4252.t1
MAACGGGGGGAAAAPIPPTNPPSAPEDNLDALIKLNQLGFYPGAGKVAVVPDVSAASFSVVSEAGVEVFQGALENAQSWVFSGESIKLADFSGFTDPGSYRIRVEGVDDSDAFVIAEQVHAGLSQAALKSYYFNRSGTELTAEYAGDWARPAAHLDTQIEAHSSAASASRPEGTMISGAGGWYDAGDFNKYIVNSGISTYTLLAAYEHFPEYFAGLQVGIPESTNSLPDILDETLWNIHWMLSMQDSADGGVYHKLTALNFEPLVMPHEATSQRYVVQKSTGAALNFAAVMAVAARVFDDFGAELSNMGLSDFAQQCRDAAVSAWTWAKNNPNALYVQPADVSTGEYASSDMNDEFAWAAAELYISLDNDDYYNEFTNYRASAGSAIGVPSWGYVMGLGYVSLLQHEQQLSVLADVDSVRTSLFELADSLRLTATESAYGVAMGNSDFDFVWGSNAIALNQSLVLIQAYRDSDDDSYLTAALANLDYVLGRNPRDISFVTGFGTRSPMDIHHRQSGADEVVAPVPGLLAGGPHDGMQDGCAYDSNLPATTYLDDWCSYSTNEVAINWNAALVYVTGALEALY